MSTKQSIRWGKDDTGNRVLEVVSVRQLNDNQARNMLVILDLNIARATASLDEMRRGRAELAALLGASGTDTTTDEVPGVSKKGE
jgi:hypothetical protein